MQSIVKAIHLSLVKNKNYLFAVLPILHFFFAMIMQQRIGYFFLTSKDPEYFHMISGIVMSTFHVPSYIDHPGIPLQIIVAISSRIAYLLAGDNSYLTDIAQNPEVYVFAANLLYNVIFALIIFYSGYKTVKYTKNLWVGVVLQLGFFGNMSLISVSGRLLPEGFMLLPLALMVLLSIKYLSDDHPEKNWNSYLISFSLLVGWGIATKLSFIPFLLIPLFILPTLKRKLKLVLFSLISFLIIAFPVVFNFNYFWDWITNMFIHSGPWGQGESNFMKINEFPERLQKLFNKDSWVFILSGVLLIEGISILFSKMNKLFVKKYSQIALSIAFSNFLLIFLITKHFAYHYFIPALLLKALMIYLILLPLEKTNIPEKIRKAFPVLGVIIAFVFMITSLINFANSSYGDRIDNQIERIVNFRSKVEKDDLLIICPYYAGAPFKEYALSGGMLMSEKGKSLFRQPMAQTYPNSFLYYPWAKKFYNWNKYVSTKEMVASNKNIFIYVGKNQQKKKEDVLNRFRKENTAFSFLLEQVVYDKKGKDKLFRLNISEKSQTSKTQPAADKISQP